METIQRQFKLKDPLIGKVFKHMFIANQRQPTELTAKIYRAT